MHLMLYIWQKNIKHDEEKVKLWICCLCEESLESQMN
jgi:hypothetical protein